MCTESGVAPRERCTPTMCKHLPDAGRTRPRVPRYDSPPSSRTDSSSPSSPLPICLLISMHFPTTLTRRISRACGSSSAMPTTTVSFPMSRNSISTRHARTRPIPPNDDDPRLALNLSQKWVDYLMLQDAAHQELRPHRGTQREFSSGLVIIPVKPAPASRSSSMRSVLCWANAQAAKSSAPGPTKPMVEAVFDIAGNAKATNPPGRE